MNISLLPIRTGAVKTFKTTFALGKVIIPVIFVIVTLDKLELLAPLAGFCQPLMKIFGLPGEAALPLLLGFLINIYAAIGAIAALTLTQREITVIAIMILTSHSLLLEAPVLKMAGLPPLSSIALRIGAACLFGIIFNCVYLGLGR